MNIIIKKVLELDTLGLLSFQIISINDLDINKKGEIHKKNLFNPKKKKLKEKSLKIKKYTHLKDTHYFLECLTKRNLKTF